MYMNIGAVRQHFANAIRESGLIPASAQISIRIGRGLGETAKFHCRWPLAAEGLGTRQQLREITVTIATSALKLFQAAPQKEREEMTAKFLAVFNSQFCEWQNDAQDIPAPAFEISFDEQSFGA